MIYYNFYYGLGKSITEIVFLGARRLYILCQYLVQESNQ